MRMLLSGGHCLKQTNKPKPDGDMFYWSSAVLLVTFIFKEGQSYLSFLSEAVSLAHLIYLALVIWAGVLPSVDGCLTWN